MKYLRSRSRISKKRKMFSYRKKLLNKLTLTVDEILELFGNKDKILTDYGGVKISFDDESEHNFKLSLLLKGGFVINKRDLAGINVELPTYIPNEERERLLEGLNSTKKMDINASEYEIVKLSFWYSGDRIEGIYNRDGEVEPVLDGQVFVASPISVVYYYNIVMEGYTNPKKIKEGGVTILAFMGIPHYDLPVYIKFIGDMLERAVYIKTEQEQEQEEDWDEEDWDEEYWYEEY